MQKFSLAPHTLDQYEGKVDSHPLLQCRSSTISGAGDGVYAVKPIPTGTVLFTYTARKLTYPLTLQQDRHYTFDVVVGDPNGKSNDSRRETYCADLYDLGGFINDIVDFRPLTQAESLALFHLKPPLTANTYNCRYQHDVTTKQVCIVTIKDIAAGQELFVDYGVNYWVPRYITTRKITGIARATTVAKPKAQMSPNVKKLNLS